MTAARASAQCDDARVAPCAPSGRSLLSTTCFHFAALRRRRICGCHPPPTDRLLAGAPPGPEGRAMRGQSECGRLVRRPSWRPPLRRLRHRRREASERPGSDLRRPTRCAGQERAAGRWRFERRHLRDRSPPCAHDPDSRSRRPCDRQPALHRQSIREPCPFDARHARPCWRFHVAAPDPLTRIHDCSCHFASEQRVPAPHPSAPPRAQYRR